MSTEQPEQQPKKKQRLLVTMTDGTEHTVTINNQDRLKFDQAAMVNDWQYPSKTDPRGAILMMTYLAWHSLQRTGAYAEPWVKFLLDHDEVEDADKAEGVPPAELRPTPPDHSPES